MPKNADADTFVATLAGATGEVEPDFFDLPVAYGDPGHTVYRERAYCYELYHRLRPKWDDARVNLGAPYTLNGELSKAGHPLFEGLGKTPDLLVHVPRTMDWNLVIVEVKSATGLADAEDVERDLFKLTEFVGRAQYERGVYLIYGDDRDPIGKVRRIAAKWEAKAAGRSLEHVHLLWHRRHGVTAAEVGWGP
jgi:hypothetical protein